MGLGGKPGPLIIDPTDALIKILKTTICGTDLHIFKEDVLKFIDRRTLDHKGVGVIEEVGSAGTQTCLNNRVTE